MNGIFSPSDDLPSIVDASADAVVSAQRGESCDQPLFPHKSNAGTARERKKDGTGKSFAQWINVRCFRNSRDLAVIISVWPCNRAIYGFAAEGAEILFDSEGPDCCVPSYVTSQIRSAHCHAYVVDRVAATGCSAESAKIHDPVVR